MTGPQGNANPDIVTGNWVERWLPQAAQPYARLMRLDRPIGSWLLLLPCWWGTAMASGGTWPNPWLLLVFAIGTIVMRGAGCTYNDIVDRDFDARVARTATRPIPSGEVSLRQAVAFLLFLLAFGLAILMTFNTYTIWLGVLSLVLVFTYPLMKRVTYWPQIFLGLAFNWGALMSWAAVNGVLAWPALVLYLAGIFWTLGYDTIYAHQDKEDDALIGVKSTAIKLGAQTGRWLIGFYLLTMGLIAIAAAMAGSGWVFWPFWAAGAAHLVWQIRNVDIDSPDDCLAKFKSNRDFGLLIFAGLIAGQVAA